MLWSRCDISEVEIKEIRLPLLTLMREGTLLSSFSKKSMLTKQVAFEQSSVECVM